MAIKYFGETALSHFLEKCKATFALITHTHTADDVGADTKGSAAEALSLAEQYMDEQLASHTHSYNDLEDRPFYDETLQTKEYIIENYDLGTVESVESLILVSPFVSEENVTIEINGETFTDLVVRYLSFEASSGYNYGYFCGNRSLITAVHSDMVIHEGSEDTGENFVLFTPHSNNTVGGYCIVVLRNYTEATISVYRTDTEIIHHALNENFIPDTISRTNHIHEEYAIAQTVEDKFTEQETLINNSLDEAKSYADTEIAALVNSAPETLDTLGELATAFQENQDMVATLDAAITTKANATDLQTTQESVSTNTENITTLLSQVLSDSLIIADAITGDLYTIQIQNGQLVSFAVEG